MRQAIKTIFVKIIVALTFTLVGCGGSVTPTPSGAHCSEATPEAGGDTALCPTGVLIVAACDGASPQPSSECAWQNSGSAWCCMPNAAPENYCWVNANGCVYQWPIPQSQLEARELVCPSVAAIIADKTTITKCDAAQ